MNIGFDAKRAFNNAAGLGNFSRSTITALANQYPEDRLFLFHPGNKNSLFTAPENSTEIKPKNLAWQILKNVWRSFQISKLARELNLDIYHGLSHELPSGIEKTGIKSVVTIHDLIYLRYPNFFLKIDRNIYDFKFRQACRVADRIHAISEQTKRDLIQFFSIPEEKIEVIYQTVNTLFFEVCAEYQKIAIRKKYQLPEEFILTVGTIEPRKNLMNLLKGMVSEKINIPLVVVGKSTGYKQRARSFIQENRQQVTFLHGIKDAELAVLYQSATAMIYPSLFEGFGLPVAEAQASGCPVITSNTSSLPEAGGDAAIYVNPENPKEIGQAIKSLLASQSQRETIISKGRINAQRFTPEKYAIQLRQLYKSIIHV